MKLNDFEKIIFNSSFDKLESSLLAGVSRKNRLDYEVGATDLLAVREVSASLISPFVFFFVWWVLISAKKKNIHRLYFFARDGQIFKKIADILNDEWSLGFDLRYFYCSRESLLPSSFTGNNLFDQNWLFKTVYGSISLSEICKRVNLSVVDVKSVLFRKGLQQCYLAPDLPLNKEDLAILKEVVFDDEFCCIARKALKGKATTTIDYIKQVDMVDGVSFAVVDSGWAGSSQYALKKLLRTIGYDSSIIGFYVGIKKDIYLYPQDEMQSFMFDLRKDRNNEIISNYICFEILFSGLHGKVTGYEKKCGCVYPIFRREVNNSQIAIVENQHKCAEDYAREVAGFFNYESFSHRKSVAVCTKLMKKFIGKPSEPIAVTYGQFAVGGEIGERDYQPLAPPITVKLFMDYVFGRAKVEGFWFQASFVRSGNLMMLFFYNLILRSKFICFYRKFFR